jgi:hypothetical protein
MLVPAFALVAVLLSTARVFFNKALVRLSKADWVGEVWTPLEASSFSEALLALA